MAKEEVPFKSIKITLSEEAINRLAKLRARGSLRSDSATIEECIRSIYDIAIDIGSTIDAAVAIRNKKSVPMADQAEALRRITSRIGRFLRLSEETMKKLR